MSLEPIFLTLEQILEIHEEQIALYGGNPGLTERGRGLLESALAQPEKGFETDFFHSWPFGMAAAYLFHICQNHPFEDGNKRVAAVAALSFLIVNGYELDVSNDELRDFVLEVAKGKKDKSAITAWLEANSSPVLLED